MILSRNNFCIEKSKDGLNILRIQKEDKKIYIGSKYRMKDQIDKFIEDIKKEAEEDSVFIIFGIGSGEGIKKIKEIYLTNKIIIFEPNVNLIDYIEKNPEEYSFLQDKNIYLIDSKKDNLQLALKMVLEEYELGKIIHRCLFNYNKIYNKEFLEFNKALKEVVCDKIIDRNTNIKFSETWFETIINNLEYIIKSNPIDKYKDKYKNLPAIIVSAGPSLSKNIDKLREIDKDMLILTGGRTLKSLLEKNIKPDLLGVVDPGEVSYELVQGYIDECKLPLLFYEGTNKEVVRHHNSSKIFFNQSNIINKIFNMQISDLGLGGSIAHTLTMSAILMGCNPIIFIGQDLAFTGEKHHADIAVNQFSNIEDNIVKEENNLYVEDINGDKVRTNELLDSFRRELEEIIRQHFNISFIDATEGGAKINGATIMTLKDAIEKYKSNTKMDCIDSLDKDLNIEYEIIQRRAIETLEQTIKAAKFIKSKCKKALEILSDMYIYVTSQNKGKVNKMLKKLDDIDKEIKGEYMNLEILGRLIYPVVYTILSDSRKKEEKDIIDKNKFLYKSILEKIDYALEPMQKSLNKLKTN